VLYAVSAISKEIRPLVIPRTFCLTAVLYIFGASALEIYEATFEIMWMLN
jgi:hypothetical protein